MSKNLFVTGTGTDVGKTYVTALMMKALKENGKNAAYFKAAMSGNIRGKDGRLIPGDALWVKDHSGITQPLNEMCPYVYEQAYSPHLASRLEGNPVELDVVLERFKVLCQTYDYVTMEGSGGILCPLRYDGKQLWLEDLIRAAGLSCVIVADAGLGAINSVVLTAEYMREKKIPTKGILLNHYDPGNLLEEDNLKMCEAMTGLKVLACIKSGDSTLGMDADDLASLYE